MRSTNKDTNNNDVQNNPFPSIAISSCVSLYPTTGEEWTRSHLMYFDWWWTLCPWRPAVMDICLNVGLRCVDSAEMGWKVWNEWRNWSLILSWSIYICRLWMVGRGLLHYLRV